jgi:PIN domain nuclease of toxin-antitoxin system
LKPVLLLLDTHLLLSLANGDVEQLPPFIADAIRDRRNALFASVASLWEMAIKHRLGKLPLPCPLGAWPDLLSSMAVSVIDIHPSHVLAEADPLPETRDPFDRLLLAICRCEDMRLATLDRLLLTHPLALRLGSA